MLKSPLSDIAKEGIEMAEGGFPLTAVAVKIQDTRSTAQEGKKNTKEGNSCAPQDDIECGF